MMLKKLKMSWSSVEVVESGESTCMLKSLRFWGAVNDCSNQGFGSRQFKNKVFK